MLQLSLNLDWCRGSGDSTVGCVRILGMVMLICLGVLYQNYITLGIGPMPARFSLKRHWSITLGPVVCQKPIIVLIQEI